MRIKQQPDGTYAVHFGNKGNKVYPTFGGYESIEEAKEFVRRAYFAHRVVFIHLLPRTWWVVKW